MPEESPSDRLVIRPATPDDIPLILAFTRELAEFERRLHEVVATEEQFRLALFGPRPAAEVLIAETADEPAGLALFFTTFSTFVGRPGIYLEDLYVRPHLRGRGIGKQLFAALAQLALERGCGRLEWSVLTWNESAIEFYTRLGAEPLDEWVVYRLAGKPLEALANIQSGTP